MKKLIFVIVDEGARPSFLGANPYPVTDAGPLYPGDPQ